MNDQRMRFNRPKRRNTSFHLFFCCESRILRNGNLLSTTVTLWKRHTALTSIFCCFNCWRSPHSPINVMSKHLLVPIYYLYVALIILNRMLYHKWILLFEFAIFLLSSACSYRVNIVRVCAGLQIGATSLLGERKTWSEIQFFHPSDGIVGIVH
jgi:hypothetical protein